MSIQCPCCKAPGPHLRTCDTESHKCLAGYTHTPYETAYIRYDDSDMKWSYNLEAHMTIAGFIYGLTKGHIISDTRNVQLFYTRKGAQIPISSDKLMGRLLKMDAIITIEDEDSRINLDKVKAKMAKYNIDRAALK